ncbi:hypothetical protein [Novilysobacter erysipheiresistens]|uniref:Uncharacterized protein n=1 Tax=Novilysobacter erysipheiresistens TaxID=1749332 RepID=A0ABU7YWF5_9GAMM|nr:hypothetical protein [Nitrobacter sp.]
MPLLDNRALALWALISGVLACSACYSSDLGSPIGNCQVDEQVYFSCPVSKQRYVSLCGNPDAGKQGIYYRFGNKDNMELEFPSNNEAGGFFYNSYHRPRAEYTEVAFHQDGYQYKVFRHYDADLDEYPRYGVAVADSSGNSETVVPCASEPVNNLSELSGILPCSQDSALGCGE